MNRKLKQGKRYSLYTILPKGRTTISYRVKDLPWFSVSSLGSPKQLCEQSEAVAQGTSRESIYFMFLRHREQVRLYCVGCASWTWDIKQEMLLLSSEPLHQPFTNSPCDSALPVSAHRTHLYFIRIAPTMKQGWQASSNTKMVQAFTYSIYHTMPFYSLCFLNKPQRFHPTRSDNG